MDYSVLEKSMLFQGVAADELSAMVKCMQGYTKSYDRGAVVCRRGEKISAVGFVLSGSVNIVNDDVWGSRTIIDNVGVGRVFAETYAFVPDVPPAMDVVAAERTQVLYLNCEKMLTTCSNACTFHSQLMKNLLCVIARKNLNLTRKINHTSYKTIRGRLLSYLSFQSRQSGAYSFNIPFNRQELADYLGVDRSAMSAELGKMKREGLIDFYKNSFVVKAK